VKKNQRAVAIVRAAALLHRTAAELRELQHGFDSVDEDGDLDQGLSWADLIESLASHETESKPAEPPWRSRTASFSSRFDHRAANAPAAVTNPPFPPGVSLEKERAELARSLDAMATVAELLTLAQGGSDGGSRGKFELALEALLPVLPGPCEESGDHHDPMGNGYLGKSAWSGEVSDRTCSSSVGSCSVEQLESMTEALSRTALGFRAKQAPTASSLGEFFRCHLSAKVASSSADVALPSRQLTRTSEELREAHKKLDSSPS
jgi:hypothetical protein